MILTQNDFNSSAVSGKGAALFYNGNRLHFSVPFPVCFHPNPGLFTYQLRFKSGSSLVQLCSEAEVNRT